MQSIPSLFPILASDPPIHYGFQALENIPFVCYSSTAPRLQISPLPLSNQPQIVAAIGKQPLPEQHCQCKRCIEQTPYRSHTRLLPARLLLPPSIDPQFQNIGQTRCPATHPTCIQIAYQTASSTPVSNHLLPQTPLYNLYQNCLRFNLRILPEKLIMRWLLLLIYKIVATSPNHPQGVCKGGPFVC